MSLNPEELQKENQLLREEIARLQDQLRTDHYKQLFEASPDIIIHVDSSYKIIVIHIPDISAERLAAVVGKDIFSVTPVHLHDRMRSALELVFQKGETVQYDSEGEALGAYRYYHNYIAPFRNEQQTIHSAYFISREITEQKKYEKAILESERKLLALFESSQHILTLLDLNDKLLWFNKKAYDISVHVFGKHLQVGTTMEEYLNKEFRAKYKEDLKKVVEGQTVTYNRKYEVQGQPYYVEILLQPVYENGTLIGISLVGTEETERKANEEKLERINNELLLHNGQLNQYSYIISHNLRGPIVTLLGLVNIFDQYRHDPEALNEIIGHIKKSATHLDTIIKDLNVILSYSETKEISKTDVSLFEEMDMVTYLLKEQIQESQARISIDFIAVSKLHTIKSYIQSILFNLLSNAIKYKRPSVPLVITIKSSRLENAVCIELQDNGLGFDLEKNRDKLFGFYKRFHSHVEGKGLGLHLIKSQIDILGGRIEVESTVNLGTLFRIYIPQ